jgi:hypothetical protein
MKTFIDNNRMKIMATLLQLKPISNYTMFGFQNLSYCNIWVLNVRILKTVG